jgi:hypothetical protein
MTCCCTWLINCSLQCNSTLVIEWNKELVAALYLLGFNYWITLKSLYSTLHCCNTEIIVCADIAEIIVALLDSLFAPLGPRHCLLNYILNKENVTETQRGVVVNLLQLGGECVWGASEERLRSIPESLLAYIRTKRIASLLTGRQEITASLHFWQRKVPSHRVNLERERWWGGSLSYKTPWVVFLDKRHALDVRVSQTSDRVRLRN